MNQKRRILLPVVFISVLGAAIQVSLMTGLLRVRVALGMIGLLALTCAVVALRSGRIRRIGFKRGFSILAAMVVPLAFAVGQPDPGDGTRGYTLLSGFALWLLGWSLYVLASATDGDGSEALPKAPLRLSNRWAALAAGFLSLAVLSMTKLLVSGRSTVIIDETLYVLQSKLFALPHFSLRFDPALQPFFMLRQSAYLNGGMFTQYPPGWPAILSVFDRFGLLWWSSPAMGAACVAVTFLLGVRIHSRTVGAAAAGLLLLHPAFLNAGSSYAASALFLLLAAYLAFGDTTAERASPIRWLAVGASLAAAFTIRPLGAIAAGTSIGLWYLIRQRPAARKTGAIVSLILTGALIPVAAALFYNSATTGDPLRFGYAAASGALASLGFGQRGMLIYSPDGLPRPLIRDFSLIAAVRQHSAIIWQACTTLLPSALFVPLLLAAAQRGLIQSRLAIAAFLLLPAGYFFWWWSDFRFYLDILPYIFIGVAVLAERLRASRPRLSMYLGVYLLVVVPAVAAASIVSQREVHRACRESDDEVRRLSTRGSILLLVGADPGGKRETLLECLYRHNTPGLSGSVVVARDIGPASSALMQRYPQHRPIRFRWDPQQRQGVAEEVLP